MQINLDGFHLTHVIEPIEFPKQSKVDKFLPPYEHPLPLDPEKPVSIGGFGPPFIYTEIKWAKDTINHTEYELAFQCGPVIVEHGGKLGVYNNNYRRLNRSAIGISNGKVVMAIVVGEKNIGLSLYEFAKYLSTPKEKGGAGCDVALNLDGGSSTQVRFYYRGIIININGLWAINSAVVVKRKKL